MTVVIEESPGKIRVFTKGADTSLEPLLLNADEKDKATMSHLNDFACLGLRTLVYVTKELPGNMSADQIKNMPLNELESGFKLLGVSGVEDLLQDDVYKCISDFRKAECQVWILTGDKDATANQIGLSTGVLCPERRVIKIEDSKNIDPNIKLDASIDVLIAGQAIAELFADESP